MTLQISFIFHRGGFYMDSLENMWMKQINWSFNMNLYYLVNLKRDNTNINPDKFDSETKYI